MVLEDRNTIGVFFFSLQRTECGMDFSLAGSQIIWAYVTLSACDHFRGMGLRVVSEPLCMKMMQWMIG